MVKLWLIEVKLALTGLKHLIKITTAVDNFTTYGAQIKTYP